jgi:hypothetical protein
MPPLTRQRTLDSILSWWSDSNPPGPTINLHAVAKPLIRFMYHQQVLGFIKRIRGAPLSEDNLQLCWDYLAYGTPQFCGSRLTYATGTNIYHLRRRRSFCRSFTIEWTPSKRHIMWLTQWCFVGSRNYFRPEMRRLGHEHVRFWLVLRSTRAWRRSFLDCDLVFNWCPSSSEAQRLIIKQDSDFGLVMNMWPGMRCMHCH